jgi:hypothetical protein
MLHNHPGFDHVGQDFDSGEITIRTFVIEEKDGSRSLINVDEEMIGKALPSAQGVIVQGLQMLLKEGKRVWVRAMYCGASGRVAILEGVRELRLRR